MNINLLNPFKLKKTPDKIYSLFVGGSCFTVFLYDDSTQPCPTHTGIFIIRWGTINKPLIETCMFN